MRGVADTESKRPTQRARGATAFRLHLGLALCLAICLGVGGFELSRALGGNMLSWAYVVEWPVLAGFGVFMWWRLLNGEPTRTPKQDPRSAQQAEAEDRDLAAWNAYLAQLHRDESASPPA